jgi:alginate O-acetyltransferase complex protein AlgI
MVTMLLGGLWHGANWTFIVWGGLHGVYISIHKWILRGRKIKSRYTYNGIKDLLIFIAKVGLTYLLVLFTWLFFRAETFGDAFYIIQKLIFWENSEFLPRIITISLSFLAITLLLDFFEYYTESHTFMLRLCPVPLRLGVLSGMVIITYIYIFVEKPLPFVYFQF